MAGRTVGVLFSCLTMTIVRRAAFACTLLSVPGVVALGQRVATATPESRENGAATLQRVTIDVDDVPLVTALQLIAHQAGLSPVYKESVIPPQARVTLHVRHVPVADAFVAVLRGTGLVADIQSTGDVAFVRGTSVASDSILAGRVIDGTTKRPLVGAMVSLDGAKQTTRTNADGQYRFLGVRTGPHTVQVRTIGYAQQAKSVTVVSDTTTIADFVLEHGAINTLDQVVVTATGAQRYRELGHVVTVINADSLVRTAPIMNIADLLTSRVPGLQVVTSGGVVGGDIALRLRGQTTSSLDPQPIVIVDGVRYKSSSLIPDQFGRLNEDQRPGNVEQRSPLNDLDVNDIETVEVVKGPSATTLYGPDSANGVILITTKRGKAGQTEWNVYVHPSLHSNVPDQRLANIAFYQAWGHDPNTGQVVPYNCTLIYQYQYHYCVLDSVTVAPTQPVSSDMSVLSSNRPQGQIGASVSGGMSDLRYFLSGDYDTETGPLTIPTSAVQYYNQIHGGTSIPSALRTPNTQQSVGLHSAFSKDFGRRGGLSLTATYNQATQRALAADFLQSLISNAGLPPGMDTAQYLQDYGQELTYLAVNSSQSQTQRLVGALNGNYQLFSWLNATVSLGTDMGFSTDDNAHQAGTYASYDDGQASEYRRTELGRTANLGLTSMAGAGIWSFRSSVGTQYSYTHTSGIDADGFNLAAGSSSISTATSVSISQIWDETVSLGSYGEEVVGLRDRLFLTGSLRLDGSSSYGDAYRPRAYPKVGISWIASDEPWLRHVPGLNQLRFRYSFGAASRAPVSAMKLGVIGSYQASIEGQTQNVYARTTLANPDIRPERTRESEYGMDATLLGGVVDASLTGYSRRTDDQINSISEPNGLPTPQWVNIGDVTGHGVEATLTVHALRRPTWNVDILASYDYQTTKVVRLGDGLQNNYSQYGGLVVGYPLGAAFGQKVVGVADTVGGHADSVIFSNEVTLSPTAYLGVLFPPHTLTVNPTLSLWEGRIRVSTLFDRATGFIQQDPFFRVGCAQTGLCLAGILKDTPLEEQAVVASGITQFEPGDYTRWREFSVTTTIPLTIVRWLRLGSAQVSLQGRNLALWTKYKGPDPESQPGSGITGLLSEAGAFGVPFPRTWSIRFDVLP